MSGARAPFRHRRAARRAWAVADPAAMIRPLAWPSTGNPVRGARVFAGTFRYAGKIATAPGRAPWDIPPTDPAFASGLHGFLWLDDLLALATTDARALAQRWTADWLARYAQGDGPGWAPATVAARLMRWLRHADALTAAASDDTDAIIARGRAAAAVWLLELPRRDFVGGPDDIAVATARVQAALCLEGFESMLSPAPSPVLADLAGVIAARVGRDGGLAARNPEALLKAFSDLAFLHAGLAAAGKADPPELSTALERMAPALRLLRHADGGLARWHGGGRGEDGLAELALAAAGAQPGWIAPEAMGFRRLAAGRTSVILDAAPPPGAPHAAAAHAGTLAFELTSGRRPMIVNCGAGERFGTHWRRACRATDAYSTLGLDGVSSSRAGLAAARPGDSEPGFLSGPGDVAIEALDGGGLGLVLSHDGYSRSHGLTHVRRLELSADGRSLTGEDMLGPFSPDQQRRLARAATTGGGGIGFALRFHLHPDAAAEADVEGRGVTILLRSGEVWVFRSDAPARLAGSIYLDPTEDAPRPSRQIVVAGRILSGPVRIGWTLAKARQSPVAVRDTIDAERQMAD